MFDFGKFAERLNPFNDEDDYGRKRSNKSIEAKTAKVVRWIVAPEIELPKMLVDMTDDDNKK